MPRPATARTTARPAPRRTILCLLRHGDAGDPALLPAADARRPLTKKGAKQARRAGKALRRLALLPADVWTSRLARAVLTADLALEAAGAKAPRVATPALAPHADPVRLLAALARRPPPGPAPKGRSRRGDRSTDPTVRWVVGHEPLLSALAALALGAPAAALRIGKGDLLLLDDEGRGLAPGALRLAAHLPAAALAALRKG